MGRYRRCGLRSPRCGIVDAEPAERRRGRGRRTSKWFTAGFDSRAALRATPTIGRAAGSPQVSRAGAVSTAELNRRELGTPAGWRPRTRSPASSTPFRAARTASPSSGTPQGGKRITVPGEYARTSVESIILYVIPQIFQSAQSLYRENAHEASGQLEPVLPKIQGRPGRLTLGGSLFSGSGSQPTHFYQPQVKLSLPVVKRADWVSDRAGTASMSRSTSTKPSTPPP